MRLLMIAAGLVIAAPLAAQDTRAGTTTTTRSITTLTPVPPAPPPMIIPGGAANSELTPLWIRGTKLICETQTNDGSPNDEAYAIVAVVALNWDELWKSKVRVLVSSVYEGMNSGDFRAVGLPIWGAVDAGLPIRSPNDVIMVASVWEHDAANVFFSTKMLEAALIAKVGTWHPGYTYGQLDAMIYDVVGDMNYQNLNRAGDDPLASPMFNLRVRLSQDELQAARSGTVVKKPVTFMDESGHGNVGKYVLRLQMGKEGVSTVVW